MLVYKVVTSASGLKELELKVTKMLNRGWKPAGSISFNQGYCYQAMVGEVCNENKNREVADIASNNQKPPISAVDSMKKLDELT